MDVDAPTTPEVEVVHADPDAPAGDAAAHDEHEAHGFTDNKYVVIAVILAVITAAEVAASYIELGWAFIPLLLSMMVIKFFIVVSFFMHLRFDNKIFARLFYIGLFLAVFVYMAALLTFRFFES